MLLCACPIETDFSVSIKSPHSRHCSHVKCTRGAAQVWMHETVSCSVLTHVSLHCDVQNPLFSSFLFSHAGHSARYGSPKRQLQFYRYLSAFSPSLIHCRLSLCMRGRALYPCNAPGLRSSPMCVCFYTSFCSYQFYKSVLRF